jgi:hypothetical protein
MDRMMGDETPDKAQPFKALAAALTLISAMLFIAGFAFRWSYYYNFGAQHLVYDLNVHAILTSSIEMIKQPRNLLATVLCVGGALIIVDLLITGARKIASWRDGGKVRMLLASVARLLGADNPLLTDCVRAAVLIYVIYMLSSQMGFNQFRKHIVNSNENPLPKVTAIMQGETGVALACGKEWKELSFIGDGEELRVMEGFHQTCTDDNMVWRLLYRDEKSIYLFASESASEVESGKRPLTIVLPNTDRVILVTR